MIRRIALLLLGLLVLASQAWAAPAVVQTQQQFVSANNPSITFASPATVGNMIVIFVSGFSSTAPTLGGSVGVSGGWTVVGNASMGAGSLSSWQYAGIVTGAGTTVSATFGTSSFSYLVVAEYSGAPASIVVDGTPTSNTGASGNQSCPTYTTTNANDLIIASANMQGGGSTTAPGAPWNAFTVLNGQFSAIWQARTTTGTFAPVWTSSNTGWTAICGGIKVPAAAATGQNKVTIVQ